MAVRHAAEMAGVPILVTENGIATADDTRRIAYTEGALAGLSDAVADGIDVRGYLHWSILDNYEWGHWGPTFGLIAVDRETFIRTPKPSLAWLGQCAATHRRAV
nr:family 1 glycosylhydrolase [Rathayibacter sp. VKM Ac-2857]